jgi:hypothetical protein
MAASASAHDFGWNQPYLHGPATATCYTPSDVLPSGGALDIIPTFGRANPSGYEMIAWQPWAYDTVTGTWAVVHDWVGTGLLQPDTGILPGQSFSVVLNPPRSRYVIETEYAWNIWDSTSGVWEGWRYDFTRAKMYQAESGNTPTAICDLTSQATLFDFVLPFTVGGTPRASTSPDVGGMPRALLQAAHHLLRPQTLVRSSASGGSREELTQRSAAHNLLTAPEALGGTRHHCGKYPATIVGTNGADRITGTPGPDVIVGLGGNDVIQGGGGDDVICGGTGADRISGGPGSDAIRGGRGRDVALGGSGFDIIEPGPGRDRLNGGGDALDILSYQLERKGVSVDLGRGISTGSGRDSFHGFNTIAGTPHSDRLKGGSTGPQLFVPLGGNDHVDGGPAGAFVAYVISNHPVTVDLSTGLATGEGSDQLLNVNGIFGSPLNDTIVGSPTGHGYLDGFTGNDSLNGNGGAYILDGSGGTNSCMHGIVYFDCANQADGVVTPPPASTGPLPPRDH